jgi:anthranilate phosphoribosyltransferase
MSHIQACLAQLFAQQSLSLVQSCEFFTEVAAGNVDPIELSAALVALKLKGETAQEIAGAAQAFRAVATPLPGTFTNAIDCCGTGGDGSNTINISTTAAIVAAACGLQVAKHGNRSVSSKSGSADLLEQLGVNIQMTPEVAAATLEKAKVNFLFAPIYHPGIRHAMGVRQKLKTRTLFNVLGPLLNPTQPKFQLLGVYDQALCQVLAEALLNLGVERAWVVHGEGCDEIALHGVTNVTEVYQGNLRHFTLTAADFGLPRIELRDIAGGTPEQNAQASLAILNGTAPMAHRYAIAANVAAMLKICGHGDDLAANSAKVLTVLAGNSALTVLESLKENSRG